MNLFSFIIVLSSILTAWVPSQGFASIRKDEPKNSAMVSPLGFPFFVIYVDLQAQYERSISDEFSILAGGLLNYKSISDARHPGSASSYGLVSSVRWYFLKNINKQRGWGEPFTSAGFQATLARAQERLTGKSNTESLFDPIILMGNRHGFSRDYFLEYGAGAIFRAKEVRAGSYVGYRDGVLPAIHFSLGLKF